MKTLTTIQMDFTKAKQRASELDDIASQLRSLANNDLSDSLQTLSAAWKGEAATAYHAKGEQLKEKLIANAKNLEDIANTIRNLAKRTYDAEMESYQLATVRTYNN